MWRAMRPVHEHGLGRMESEAEFCCVPQCIFDQTESLSRVRVVLLLINRIQNSKKTARMLNVRARDRETHISHAAPTARF